MSTYKRQKFVPSYKTGYAPHVYPPRYPSLYRGLLGGWAMGLGSTGAAVFDILRRNRATTSAIEMEDWVLSGGAWSLLLDGVNERINIPLTSGHFANLFQLSASCWFRPTAVHSSTYKNLFSYRDAWAFYYGHSNAARRQAFTIQAPASTWTSAKITRVDFSNAANLNKWYHLCCTWDHAKMRVFLDGSLDVEVNLTSTIAAGSGLFQFGSSSGTGNDGFPGNVDDFAVWNRALRHSEIKILASNRLALYEYDIPTVSIPIAGPPAPTIQPGQRVMMVT